MNLRFLFRAAIGAGIAACAGGCGSHAAPPPPPPVAVQTTTIERRTLATYESLDGTVDPFLSANLAPQQSGTLVAIYANEGDRVHKGEVLAKIDDSILRATLTQQQATDVQNVAKLQQSKIQLPITTVSNDAALVQARRTLALQVKTQIADAANVANTKLTYDADADLLKQGFVAKSVYEQARAAYVLAQQTLAQDNDKLVQDRAAVAEAQQNLANTPLQQQVIAQNRGAVSQSQGLVQQYQAAVSQTTINAPFDGVVTARTLDPGSYASPSQAIYAVSQIDPIYVDFNVKDTDLAYVRTGKAVSFATSANPSRRYSGTVADVNAVPTTGTLLYRARIVEPNHDYSLRGGLEVSVRVTTQLHRDTLTVPRAAVIQNGSDGTIYSVENNGGQTVLRNRTVHLGLQTTGYVEVSGGGIRAGMPIVLNQTDNLHDGLAVATPSPSPSPR
jgi:RND family efflux transporter MFP subunit